MTRATFACSDCIRAKASDKLQEILHETDTHMRRSPAQKSKSHHESKEILENYTSTLDASSASPASQMPPTQVASDGDETESK